MNRYLFLFIIIKDTYERLIVHVDVCFLGGSIVRKQFINSKWSWSSLKLGKMLEVAGRNKVTSIIG